MTKSAEVLSCQRAGDGWLIRVRRGKVVQVFRSERELKPGTAVSMEQRNGEWVLL